jgi:hypothetical protein
MSCREEMERDLGEVVLGPEEALDGAAVEEGWVAVDSVLAENAYAPIAAIG